jgi:DNA-binding CsgD family transcriptional regulator
MSFWRKFLQTFKGRSAPRAFELDQPLVEVLQHFAEKEKRPREEVAADLLSAAMLKRQAAEENLRTWRSLSTREQQVTALACLHYTNPQTAARLCLSPDTVKTHVRNVLRKFNVHSKAELRQALNDWDFSEWK